MRLALSLWLLMVVACDAYTYTGRGWTPWAWPASNQSPTDIHGNDGRNWNDAAPTGGTKRIASLKDLWVGDVYHALWEKTVISQNLTAGSNLVKATWYRTERANLVAFKQAFPAIAGGFVDFAATEATVVSYMITSGTQVLPTFTVSNLLIRAGLPTNYLTYTPYRMIGGYGSLDGAVTPSNVAAGFTVKDYGWDGLKRMITNLTCTQVVPSCRIAASYGSPYWIATSTNPSFSSIKSAAGATVTPPIEGVGGCNRDFFPYYYAELGFCFADCSVYAEAHNLSYTYTNRNDALVPRVVELYGSVTNDQRECRMFYFIDTNTFNVTYITNCTEAAFNNYGSGLTEGNWHLIESETLSATAPYSRTRWGAFMSTPTWPSDPTQTFPDDPPGSSGGQWYADTTDTPSLSGSYRVLGLFLLNRWTCYY